MAVLDVDESDWARSKFNHEMKIKSMFIRVSAFQNTFFFLFSFLSVNIFFSLSLRNSLVGAQFFRSKLNLNKVHLMAILYEVATYV